MRAADYLYDIDLYAHGTKQQMLEWQAYVDALGIPCRVWRAQDRPASRLKAARISMKTSC